MSPNAAPRLVAMSGALVPPRGRWQANGGCEQR
jgi:hypothetical protein